MNIQKTLFAASGLAVSVSAQGASEQKATFTIDTDTVLHQTDPRLLTGTNVALWSRAWYIDDPIAQASIKDWNPFFIRMPGGSWSNEYYWNGNGVRIGNDQSLDNFDASKQLPDGTWKIDYSAYKPGFRVHGEDRHLDPDYHGDLDVKTQHEWILDMGSEAMVTVNVGSAKADAAVEWMKWSEKNDYGVRYWEIGNELNGDWELGHRLPDGTTMTGEKYAEIFKQYAQEMRAVDPDAKLGGPACSDLALNFVEELIRDGGDDLDFVSIHAYPVGGAMRDTDVKFSKIDDVRVAAKKIHGWIEKYQPDRKDEIEIGVTEWNLKVNEDRDTADLLNGLWSAVWIGALFEEGFDFATQWDLFTNTEEGGHGAFYADYGNQTLTPKSQYWSLWMWSNLMGDTLHASEIAGSDKLHSFVTSDADGMKIMFVNQSETDDAVIDLDFGSGKSPATSGTVHTFSSAEYFWDPHATEVVWSTAPTESNIDLEYENLVIPEFSIIVVELPWEEQPSPSDNPLIPGLVDPQLRFILPTRFPSDRPIEGFIVAKDASGRRPFKGDLSQVELSVEGPAEIDAQTLVFENSAATFTIMPSDSGIATIRAQASGVSTMHLIDLVAIEERTEVLWTFDNPIEEWYATSKYKLAADSNVRRNQEVAMVSLDGDKAGPQADQLFVFEPMPEGAPLATASGIVGKIKASHDWSGTDPKESVKIVLQSGANHWMPLGEIPLSELKKDWVNFKFTFDDPALLDAMPKLYAIRFLLDSKGTATGQIHLDDLGLVILSKTSGAAKNEAVEEREAVLWTFDNPVEEWNAYSAYKLDAATSESSSQVAVSKLVNDVPEPNADMLFELRPMPDDAPLATANGIIGKLKASADWECKDPDAYVNIVLQSTANHWMPIGTIPIKDLQNGWVDFRMTYEDQALIDAMPKLYAVRILFSSQQPATGEIYLDDFGIVYRSGM